MGMGVSVWVKSLTVLYDSLIVLDRLYFPRERSVFRNGQSSERPSRRVLSPVPSLPL